jgi:organic hydroperoxide reductase OsmC/OhrA
MKHHVYEVQMDWTGNDGEGTRSYSSYRRDHVIRVNGKPELGGSSDPAFRGDPSRYSPEDLLVGSVSACHMLWYLHLCSVHDIVVTDYADRAVGRMDETPDGSGAFVEVLLRPAVTIRRGGNLAKAQSLHEEAHRRCFIANSVKFPVHCEAMIAEGTRGEGQDSESGLALS